MTLSMNSMRRFGTPFKERKSRFDGDGNFETAILRAIQIANSGGWWQPPVHAAVKANGGNEKLRDFLRKCPVYSG